MTPEQCKRIIESQQYAFKQHGYHPNALFWSTTKVQEIRFEVIKNIGIETGDSVLDIGCGFGDFSAFLQRNNIHVDFTGIDLSSVLLQEGGVQFPDIKLFQGDLFDFDPAPQSYDFVTLSGTLNRALNDDGNYAFKTIKRMFKSCRKGIAFNLLDARDEWTAGRWDLQSFKPELIQELATKLCNKVEIIDDYLKNDFTVYLMKS